MDRDKLVKEVNKIFIDVFDDQSIILNENTTSSDIEAWDSLSHIQMITAIEKYFQIRFELNELLNFKNVGDLCMAIQNKINQVPG
ncbi:MAG TPA: acyl carrier protein [Chitinophagaceae bacterium]|nr:acyl carrier protein [Chitinophagaceae bacterium]